MKNDRAYENKKIRQEALRQQLAAQGHVQHVVEIAEKLGDSNIETKDVQRLKTKAEIHLKLINKYLPDLKSVELSNDPDNPVGRHELSDIELAHELSAIFAAAAAGKAGGNGSEEQAAMEAVTRAADGSTKH